MTSDRALDALADHYGILSGFRDMSGQERLTGIDTKKALLRAIGVQLDSEVMIREALEAVRAKASARTLPAEMIVEAGKPGPDLPKLDWQLEIEGNISIEGRGPLPPLIPGVHILTLENSGDPEKVTLIAAPRAAPSVKDLTGQSRLWGATGALYAMQSSRNLGLGDFEDLARATCAAAAQGAGFFGINPVHALGWSDTETISPYSPSHRGFLNTFHIAADRIPGLENSAKAKSLLATKNAAFARVRATDFIDYPQFRAEFAKLLEGFFGLFLAEATSSARADFATFAAAQGRSLQDFALFEALSEIHGPDWREWPADLRSPDCPGVRSMRQALADRIQFHSWLQCVAAAQLTGVQSRAIRAGMSLGLYLDLAVGPRRGGAEAWCERGCIAQGVSIGAPPDHLSPEGQNWNLAAYSPGRLLQGRYHAFRQSLGATLSHAGLIRIDHVLGMNRSYWTPDDGSPGGYIRQPMHSLLAIIAIEADRARTAVVGEDLGLVPEDFRETISARGLYRYSVLQYEKGGDCEISSRDTGDPNKLACFGTHDTPTLCGFRVGRDIDWWQKLGWVDEGQAAHSRRARRGEFTKLMSSYDDPADSEPTIDPTMRVHARLAQSSAALVSVQIDDLARETEAQNLPGTIDEHPNWRRRSSVSVERYDDWPELVETGHLMREFERGPLRADEKEPAE